MNDSKERAANVPDDGKKAGIGRENEEGKATEKEQRQWYEKGSYIKHKLMVDDKNARKMAGNLLIGKDWVNRRINYDEEKTMGE